jgi:arylsulfatase A-like enzyme
MTSYRIAWAGLTLALGLALGCSAKSTEASKSSGAAGLHEASSGLPQGAKAAPESGEPELEPPLETLSEPHFGAFDLLANRPLGHRIRRVDGALSVVLDARTPDFVRYIHGGHAKEWVLDVDPQEQPAAAVKGRTAKIWVPALRPGAPHQLRLRLFNPARWENKLTVELNGTALDPITVENGWQTVVIDVPVDAGLRAENEIELAFSNLGRIGGRLSGGALAWMELGQSVEGSAAPEENGDGDRAAADGDGARQAGGDESADEETAKGAGAPVDAQAGEAASSADTQPSGLPLAQDALELAPTSGLAWYLWIPDGASLDLEVNAREGCGVRTRLFVEGDDGEVVAAADETRNLVLGRGEVQQTAVDLSKWSNQVARLELYASDACEDSLSVERAALVVPGEAPRVPEGVEPPERVIVWMIDTLRADYLPLHFDTDVQAPNLQKLAAEGASFALAFQQGNESRTSHASFFTGQYPSRHGLAGKGILRPHHHLLSEAMQDAGFHTGIHVANGFVSRTGGFAQGWNHYVNNLRENWRIDAEGIVGHGMSWLEKNLERESLFLYLGTIDPHVTYRAHEGIIETYDGDSYSGKYRRHLLGEELGKIKGGRKVSERDKKRIVNLYKNEITFNDRAFGQLRAALEEADLWEGTMVVVTSDHGEEFWEHGSVGHGHNVFQELVHVPLIVYYPPLVPEGTTVEAGVDILDVYPTVLDAVGADPHEDVQGKSLLPLVHNVHGGYPEPAIATHYLVHYAMQMQHWKLYLRRGAYRLYDRRSDPLQQTDVASDHPLASRFLLDAMGWFRAHRSEWHKLTWGVPSNLSGDFLERVAASR